MVTITQSCRYSKIKEKEKNFQIDKLLFSFASGIWDFVCVLEGLGVGKFTAKTKISAT